MNHLLSIIVLSLIWVPYQSAQISLGIEYQLNEKSPNPWGDLNITGNYSTQVPFQEKKPIALSLGIKYEIQPGLMGNLGHMRLVFDAAHPDEKIHRSMGILVNEANTIFNYNPTVVSTYKNESDSYKAATEKEHERIKAKTQFLQEHSLEKSRFLKNKEYFTKLKHSFESSSYNDTNPNAPIIKAIIKEMDEEYKKLEKKYE